MDEEGKQQYLTQIYNVEVVVNVDTGIAVSEEWRKDGQLDRQGGPAEISRDHETGVVRREVWSRNGVTGRDDPNKPSVVFRDPKTGETILISYHENGNEVRAVRFLEL